MWKICGSFASGSMILFIAYATVASSSPQNHPWYLDILLWGAIGAAIICIVTGFIWLIQSIWGRKFKIDIHKSKSTSRSSYHDDKYRFDIDFTLKTSRPPVDIAWVELHVQGIEIQSTEHPFKLDNTTQSHSSTFESLPEAKPSRALRAEDKYYLSVFALGKEWSSKEFQLDRSNVVIEPRTAHITVPPDVLAKIKKSITDKENS